MSELLEEHAEAKDYCKSVIADSESYRFNEFEVFEDLRPAVLATTNVDTHDEAFDLSALHGLVEYVANKPYWLNVEHDPLIHPQGRVIAAKVFQSADEKFYFVAAVLGIYGAKTIKSFSEIGIDSFEFNLDEQLEGQGDLKVDPVTVVVNPVEIDGELIDEWLGSRPGLLNPSVKRAVRKEADPIAVVTFAVGIGFFLKPYLAEIGKKLGEKSGDEIIQFYDWLKGVVFKSFKKIKNDRFRFGFLFEYKGVMVEFVVPSKDEAILAQATDDIGEAYILAVNLVDRLAEFVPNKLIVEFDIDQKIWKPSYVATQRVGIITDRPTLGVLDKMQGLSVGGVIGSETGDTTILHKKA